MPDAVSRSLSLRPGPGLYERIALCKQRVRARVGRQLYLDDPPHLTLYIAAFPPTSLLPLAAGALAAQNPVRVRVVGWHAFLDDALTGHNTLSCAIHPDDRDRLRALQGGLVAALAPHRDAAATTDRFASRWDNLTPAQRRCVEQFGFPYLGADWQPHFTVASIHQHDWAAVMDEVGDNPPVGEYECSVITEYVLSDGVPREVVSCLFGRRAA